MKRSSCLPASGFLQSTYYVQALRRVLQLQSSSGESGHPSKTEQPWSNKSVRRVQGYRAVRPQWPEAGLKDGLGSYVRARRAMSLVAGSSLQTQDHQLHIQVPGDPLCRWGRLTTHPYIQGQLSPSICWGDSHIRTCLEGDLVWHHGAFSRQPPEPSWCLMTFLGGCQAVPSPPFPVPVRHPLESITAEATPCIPQPSPWPLLKRGLHHGT